MVMIVLDAPTVALLMAPVTDEIVPAKDKAVAAATALDEPVVATVIE